MKLNFDNKVTNLKKSQLYFNKKKMFLHSFFVIEYVMQLPLLLSLTPFLKKYNTQWFLGYVGSWRIHLVYPSNPGKEGCICRPHLKGAFRNGTALTRRSDAIALRMHPSKDASPELRHSHWERRVNNNNNTFYLRAPFIALKVTLQGSV